MRRSNRRFRRAAAATQAACGEPGLAVDDVATYVGAVAGTGRRGQADRRQVDQANCAACHTLADAGTTGKVGPNLTT